MRIALALAALLPASAAEASVAGVTATCLGLGGASPSQCACATRALVNARSTGTAALYGTVGVRYLDLLAAGKPADTAWTGAILDTASKRALDEEPLRTAMTDLATAHRDAIDACR